VESVEEYVPGSTDVQELVTRLKDSCLVSVRHISSASTSFLFGLDGYREMFVSVPEIFRRESLECIAARYWLEWRSEVFPARSKQLDKFHPLFGIVDDYFHRLISGQQYRVGLEKLRKANDGIKVCNSDSVAFVDQPIFGIVTISSVSLKTIRIGSP
jgi:hypothetical protein